MKALVFAYHNIGCVGLRALLETGFEVQAVLTHEDNPEENVWFDSVADLARQAGVRVLLPPDPNAPEVIEELTALQPDILFSFYYRNLLKRPLLELPRVAALNLHGSYLPAYRGRCPVNWVLVNGETETGVTLHHMIEKPDAGDIVVQRRVDISDADTAHSLYGKLTQAAEGMLAEVLPLILSGQAPRLPQDHTRASYYGGRRPEDGHFHWGDSARNIYNLIRAVTHPYPGAFTEFAGGRLRVWWASPYPGLKADTPGTVSALENNYPIVATGMGHLRLISLQVNEGPLVEAPTFVSQYSLAAGSSLLPVAGIAGNNLGKEELQ